MQGHGREQGQREPQEPVGPHLEQDAREQHRPGRGRFHVCVGKPGVEREHRHLDGEREEEGAEQPEREGPESADVRRQVRVRKRVHPGALANDGDEREDRHQHEERAKEGVHEELDGRVQTALPAPHPDDEVHGNEHDFPHHVKEEQIEGHEHPDHARREHEHQRIKAALARRDVGVAAEHRQRDQERREQDHKQRDPVQADRVADSPARDPRRIEDELEAARRRERPPQGRRDRELDQAGRERDVLGPARRRDHHDEGGERGPREQRGEHPLAVHGYRTAAPTTARTPMTNKTTYTPTSPVCSRLPNHPTARDAAAVPFTSRPSTIRASTIFQSTSRESHITGRTMIASYSSSTYHFFQSSRARPVSGGASRAGTSASGLSRRNAPKMPNAATRTAPATSAHSVDDASSTTGRRRWATLVTGSSQCSRKAWPPNSSGTLRAPPVTVSRPSTTSGPVMTGGASCRWSRACSPVRFGPWKV